MTMIIKIPKYATNPPQKVFLECGSKPHDAIFELDDDEVKENQSFVLDRVFVDTSCCSSRCED